MLKSNNAHTELVWFNLRGLLVTDGLNRSIIITTPLIMMQMITMLRAAVAGYFCAEKQCLNTKHIQS